MQRHSGSNDAAIDRPVCHTITVSSQCDVLIRYRTFQLSCLAKRFWTHRPISYSLSEIVDRRDSTRKRAARETGPIAADAPAVSGQMTQRRRRRHALQSKSEQQPAALGESVWRHRAHCCCDRCGHSSRRHFMHGGMHADSPLAEHRSGASQP